jgi:hypothetical protein
MSAAADFFNLRLDKFCRFAIIEYRENRIMKTKIFVGILAFCAASAFEADQIPWYIPIPVLVGCFVFFYITVIRPDLKAGKEAERQQKNRKRVAWPS